MNCNCINDIENKLIGREYGDKKKKIIKAKIIDVAFMFNSGTVDMCSNSRLELTVEGYKKSTIPIYDAFLLPVLR